MHSKNTFSRDKKVDNNKRLLNSKKLMSNKIKTMILLLAWLSFGQMWVKGAIMNHGGVPYAISNPEGMFNCSEISRYDLNLLRLYSQLAWNSRNILH